MRMQLNGQCSLTSGNCIGHRVNGWAYKPLDVVVPKNGERCTSAGHRVEFAL